MGFARREMKLSMHCVMASMPQAAVIAGAARRPVQDRQAPTRGTIKSDRKLFLNGGS